MDNLKEKLVAAKVVGDVVDDFTPKHQVHVSFASGSTVSEGNVLFPKDVSMEPNEVEWGANEGAWYTLIKTDPDAPSRYGHGEHMDVLIHG